MCWRISRGIWKTTQNLEVNNAKPIGFDGLQSVYSRNYNVNRNDTHNFTNGDFSEAGDTYWQARIYAYVDAGYVLRQNVLYTIDLVVLDELGNQLENANVTFYNTNGDLTSSILTYSNGSIDTQKFISKYGEAVSDGASSVSNYLYFNRDDSGTLLYPYTMIIEKEGYQTYNMTFNLTEKKEWTIALQEATGSGGDIVVYSSGEKLPEASDYPYLNYEISREKDTYSGLLTNPYIIKKEVN